MLDFVKLIYLKRNSILKKWFLSYLLILLIPLVGAVCICLTAYGIIRDEIITTNSIDLKIMRTSIDNKLNQAREISASIIVDERFRDLVLMSNTRQDIVEKQTELIKIISNFKGTSSVNDIFIYIPAIEYCITSTTANDLYRLYYALFYTKRIQSGLAEWRAKLSPDIPPNSYMISPYLSYEKYDSETILYYTNSKAYIPQNAYGTNVFVSMRFDELNEYVSSRDASAVLILDKNGGILKRYGNAAAAAALDEAAFDVGGSADYQIVRSGADKYVFSYIDSTVSNFVYAVATPYRIFWSKSYIATSVFVTVFLIVSMLGLFIATALLFRNYTPLRQTLSLFSNSDDVQKNEFELINEQILNLHSNEFRMKSSYVKQQIYMKEKYLLSLLEGSNWDLTDNEMLETLTSDFSGKLLAPVRVFIENEQESFLAKRDGDDEKISLEFVIANILDELLNYKFDYIKTGSKTGVIVIFSLTPETKADFDAVIVEKLEELRAFLNEFFKLSVTAVIGTYTMSLESLSDIYAGIKSAHDLLSKTNGGVIRTEQFTEIPNTLEISMDAYTVPLCKAVQMSAYNDAVLLTDALFGELGRQDIPFQSMRFHLFAIVSKLQGVYFSAQGEDDRSKLFALMDGITDAKTPVALNAAFRDIMKFLCGADGSRENYDNDIHMLIERYVQEHYGDSNLSLTQIAEYVGLSAKYVSKLFRLKTGQGLPDYINLVRVQKAKDILKTEKLTVNELSERVGYNNVKTFRRVFQKVERVNPSEYGM